MSVSILDFKTAPEFAGASFPIDSHATQDVVLAGAWGLPMTKAQRKLFKKLSGGRKPVKDRVVRELWVVAGRRSDKSHTFAAGQGVYIATIHAAQAGLLDNLAPGETGIVALIAVDRSQARVLIDYVKGILKASPVLAGTVQKEGAEYVLLTNGVRIEVFTNNFRTVRGRTLLAVVLDECAYYRSEQTANPDIEIYRAVIPALATTGGMLIGVSSPYAKRGLLYDKYARYYGKPGDVLVVQGSTLDFNPTLDPNIVKEALEADPEAAKAEWLGEFRNDLEAFVTREIVDAAVRPEPLHHQYQFGRNYYAFCDATGGGPDEFTLAIGHLEGEKVIVDTLQARRGSPNAITKEYAGLVKAFGIRTVKGDRYAADWVRNEFGKHGITYSPSPGPKNDLYLQFLPALNSGRVELPPDEKMVLQLTGLERRTSRAGRDSIDHPPRCHDDRANAVAGLVAIANRPKPTSTIKRLKYL